MLLQQITIVNRFQMKQPMTDALSIMITGLHKSLDKIRSSTSETNRTTQHVAHFTAKFLIDLQGKLFHTYHRELTHTY